jgi:hypothetical protein
MTDAPSPTAAWNARLWYSAIAMVFSLVMVVWLVAFGQPTNALHATALSWCFMLVAFVLGMFAAEKLTEFAPWRKP